MKLKEIAKATASISLIALLSYITKTAAFGVRSAHQHKYTPAEFRRYFWNENVDSKSFGKRFRLKVSLEIEGNTNEIANPKPPSMKPPPLKGSMLEGQDVEETAEDNSLFFTEQANGSSYYTGYYEEDDETTKVIKDLGKKFADTVVAPIVSGDIKKGVAANVIKGAAISGASLGVLAGQSIAAAGLTGLGAAYVSITHGPSGEVLRGFGGVAWNSTMAAIRLYNQYDTSRKLAIVSKSFISRAKSVVNKADGKSTSDDVAKLVSEAESAVAQVESVLVEEAKKSRNEDNEIGAEEEAWVTAAREARAAEEEALAAEAAAAEEEALLLAEEEARLLAEAEAKEAAEKEARLKAEEEAKAIAEEEARLLAEAEAKEAAAEEARLKAEEEAKALAEEEARLLAEAEAKEAAVEEARLKAEEEAMALAEEEARQNAEIQTRLEEESTFISEDDWEASIQLAHNLNDNGMKLNVEDDVKSQWDAARDLAKSLADVEMKDDNDPNKSLIKKKNNSAILEMDNDEFQSMEDLGKAAREAVSLYEEQMKSQASSRKTDINMLGVVNGDAIVGDDNYEKLTVVKLKELLRSRGLKVSGRKAELIERLRSQ